MTIDVVLQEQLLNSPSGGIYIEHLVLESNFVRRYFVLFDEKKPELYLNDKIEPMDWKDVSNILLDLENLNFWGINDFMPEDPILDGSWFIIMIKSKESISKTLYVFCPDLSNSKELENICNYVDKILQPKSKGLLGKIKEMFT